MTALIIAARLLLGDPTALEAECTTRRKAGDDPAVVADVCRRAFEAVPGGPGDRRTLLLATAHSLYQKALRTRADSALACADAMMLRTYAEQLAALPDGERPGDRADVEKAQGDVDLHLVADCTPPATAPTPPSIPSSSPRPVQKTPVGAPRTPDRPRRGLRLAGGTLVGLGLGSGLAMVGTLVRGDDLRTRAESVHDSYAGGMIIPADIAKQYNEDVSRGERANQLAIAFGVSAGILAGTGAMLLIVDKRDKARRVALSPFAISTPGVRLSMEF